MTLTKEFAEAVGPVIRWALENGWQHDVYPGHYRNASWTRVIDDGSGWLSVNGLNETGWTRAHAQFRPSNPQQAIDILAALGVIPARFSSQWQEGRDVALEAVAAAVLLPDLEPVTEFVEGHPIGQRSHA